MSVDLSELESSNIWGKICDVEDPVAWAVCGFAEGSKDKVVVQAQGSGGISEVLDAFNEDEVQFAGLLVTAIDRKGRVTSKRAKLIYICWTGPKVKLMVKARTTGQKSPVQAHFQGYHVDYSIYEKDEISEDDIIAKLRASGGAHQPDFYHFGFWTEDGAAAPTAASGEAAGAGAAAASAPAPAAAAEPAAEEPAAAAEEPAAAAEEPAAAAEEPAAAAEEPAAAAEEPAAAAEEPAAAAEEPAAAAEEPAAAAEEPAAAAEEPAAEAEEPAAEAEAEPAAEAEAEAAE